MKNRKTHYGVYVAIAMFFMYFLNAFVMGTESMFITPVCEELGISRAQFGFGSTILMVGIAICMKPIISPLFNKLDIRVTLTYSVLLHFVALVLRATAQNIWYFYIGYVLLIFGFAPVMNLMLSILSTNWFYKKQGTVMSIIALGQGIAGIIFGAVGGHIIQNMGWRSCYWVWAILTLIIGLPCSLFVIRKTPQEMGLMPLGYEEEKEMKVEQAVVKGISAKKAFKTDAFWLIGLGIGLNTFGVYAATYINSYTQTLGYSAVMAGYITSAYSVGNLCGKAMLGTVADKIGANRSTYLAITMGIVGIGGVALFAESAPFAIVFILTVCAGILNAAGNLVFPLLTRQVFGDREYAKIWPSVVIFLSFIGAFGLTAWGLLIDILGSYRSVMLMASGLLIVVLIMIMIAAAQGRKLRAEWTEE